MFNPTSSAVRDNPNGQDMQQLLASGEKRPIRIPETEAATRPAENLLHKLGLLQVEIEMQIEELWQVLRALEETCERYVDLHEFSSVAYITLTRQGVISGMNLAAAALLGTERKKLLLRRFLSLVAPEDSDRWISCFVGMLQRMAVQSCELALKHSDGHIFCTRLEYLNMETGGKSPMRIALTDISERKHDEPNIIPAAIETHDGMVVATP